VSVKPAARIASSVERRAVAVAARDDDLDFRGTLGVEPELPESSYCVMVSVSASTAIMASSTSSAHVSHNVRPR
jgi:hypothetical protein